VLLSAQVERAAGLGVRVARFGSGPPLLLLHGYPDDLQGFSRIAPLLAARHQVIAFDWPGMGGSGEVPRAASPAGRAELLVTLLDAWRVERATFAGIDMGAPPALVLAALHPERVERLVVMNSLLFGDAPTARAIRTMRNAPLRAAALRVVPGVVFEAAVSSSSGELDAELRGEFRAAFLRPEVLAHVRRLCAGYEKALPDLPLLYERIAAPTLSRWGEHDDHFPPEHGRRLQALIGGSRFEVLERARHWMHLAEPQRVAAAILAFTAAA